MAFGTSLENSDKSVGLLKVGESVPVVLEGASIDDKGNLTITFKGTSLENPGQLNQKFWKNEFDSTDSKYNETRAEIAQGIIQQVLEAYIPGNAWVFQAPTVDQYFATVVKLLNAVPKETKTQTATIKVVYRYNSDEYTTLSTSQGVISTALKPKALKLSTKANNAGIPYDRVLPLAAYVKATSAAPAASENPFADDLAFPTEEKDPFTV